MVVKHFVAAAFSAGMGLTAFGTAYGQTYPARPIRIVASEAGSGSDFAVRLISPGLSSSLGQQIVIDNRGGNVIIAGEIVWKAPPDGYTLIVNAGTLWIGPLLQKTPYDVVTDFAPISLVSYAPNLLVVHPSLPVKSVKDLVALAKARPSEINYGSGPAGGTNHIAAELLADAAGIKITRVAYKGTGPALAALVGGEVQLFIPNVASAMPLVKSGRLKALAITSTKPSALAPGVPTVATSGAPGYEIVSMVCLFAPAKTPAAIINQLSREIAQVVNRPEIKERFFDSGVETVGSTPEEMLAAIKNDIAKTAGVIKKAGIRTE